MFLKKITELLVKRSKPLIEKINVAFAYLVYLTGIFLPLVFVYGLHWWNPCKVSLAGYWLLSECRRNPDEKISIGLLVRMWKLLVKSTIFLINHWIWAFQLHTIVYIVGVPQILCTLSLREYLLVFSDQFLSKRSKILVHEKCLLYRVIQILALWTNIILNRTLVSLISASITLLALGLAGFVRLEWSSSNLMPLVVSLIMVMDAGLAVVVLLGGMVGVYLESKRVFQILGERLSTDLPRIERMYLQKFYRSCRLIRINLGSSNFLDALTPLNCLNFAVSITVQILLISQ